MRIDAAFVTSVASAEGFPTEGLAEIALVGRSNVGKSSLINALVRQKLARTSAAPGKTRLANVYQVARGASGPVHLVDLPGYGYARGGAASAREFGALTSAYFGQRDRIGARYALLLVDARHPGLQSDVEAWGWLGTIGGECAVVATKIDKLARGERIRAIGALQSVFDAPVLPVSAVTGEGLDQLWTLIDRLANNRNPTRLNRRRAAAPPPPPRWSGLPPTSQTTKPTANRKTSPRK